MAKGIRIYLKIADEIILLMKKGLELEAARRQAFEKYKKELREIKNAEKN